MDKTVTLVKLLMTRENDSFPVYALPEKYRFCMYRDGMERDWAAIESAVGEFQDEEKALIYFGREFMPYREDLYRRMIFVLDEESHPVATLTAWYGDLFGDKRSKLHWFAVKPTAQRKGLARPLLTRCMEIFRDLDGSARSYLGFQTWSYRAARLYMHFGYSPYCGARPENWVYSCEEYEKANHIGWMIVHNKILELLIDTER